VQRATLLLVTALVTALASTMSCSCGASRPTAASIVLPSSAPPPAASGEPADESEGPVSGEEGEGAVEAASGVAPPPGFAGSTLLAEVDRELARVRSTHYSHRTQVDETAGSYAYDCSGFLVYALSRAAPDALASLQATTPRRPRSSEIVAFLTAIQPGGRNGRWQRVARVADLLPGDVVAWLKTADSRSTNTGHTMVVHGAPVPDPERPGAFVVPIVDSTGSPHRPGDARADAGATGLGRGEIVLLTDAAGAPVGYRWSRGKRSREKTTTIALGRLR
jgi:hypothetical protein